MGAAAKRERERRRAPVHERVTPTAEVVGADDASERMARRWSDASAPILPAFAPRGCLCCAAGAACGRHSSTRPHAEPLPADVRARHAPRFGAALDDVRIDRSPAAAADAAALGARAFTVGAEIAFAGGRFEPSTPTGDRLLTHELVHATWHRDGRLRRDVDPAGVRERTSTSSGTDALPLVGLTAHDWISLHGGNLVRAVRSALTSVALPLNVPELGWLTDQGAFLDAALQPLTGLGGSTVWTMLPAYLRPDSLTDAVNIGRDCHPALTGTPGWVTGVTDEVVRRLTLRLVESIGRMARVVARHLTRDWRPDVLAGSVGPTVTGPLVTFPGAVALAPVAAGVAFGHPIDPYVYTALRASTRVNAPAYRAAHPDEFTAEAEARENRPLRPVRYQSLAGQGLPSWIRVTEPADATVEEVAATLYGESTAAYRLTAAPPMFGLPRTDIAAADFRNSLWPSRAASSTEPSEWQPRLAFAEGLRLVSALDDAHVSTSSAGTVSPELELLTGAAADPAMVDAIALRAAARIMPTPGASRDLIRERMAYIANQLAAMLPSARALARPPDAPALTITFTGRGYRSEPYVAPASIAMANRVTAARTRVLDRMMRLNLGPASDALDWDGHSRGQLEIVTACGNGLANAQVLAAQYQGWPVIHQLIVEIADAYVGAAEISDLYPSARARLDAAERRSILFPVTAMELLLASLRAALDEARTSEITSFTPLDRGELYGVNAMDREEAGLRTRLANLRGLLLSDPRAAAIELRAVLDAINSLQTGVTLALNLDTCDRVWQALHSSTSFMGEIRSLWGGGNTILRNGQHAATRLGGEWFKIMLEWRYGDRAKAREQLRVKAQGEEWRGWVRDMAAAIRDHQSIDRLMTFAAMVGIAVLSFGIGAYVEAAAGAAWGVTAGVTSVASVGASAVGVLAEATVFTGLSYPLTTNNPTLGGLGEAFVTNLAFIGGGRALAHGIGSLVTVDRAALEAGSITLEQFRRAERLRTVLSSSGAIVGMGAANLVLAERQSQRERGHGLSGSERASLTLENAAFVAATMLATALLRRPLLALRLEGEFGVLRSQHETSLRALERTLAEFERAPSPEAGLRQRLIADVQRAVRSEQRLVDRLRQVVETADARAAAGATREARTMLRTAGITDALAAELRSGSLRSDVLGRVSAMQAMRIANALQPVGSDYAIPSAMFGEAEAFYRSSPNTRVVMSDSPLAFLAEGEPFRLEPRPGDPPAGELPPARLEPGGRSFLVIVEGERPFRVYERRAGAVGELAGRVELAATPEAAAAARDPMARPTSGGRAGASEIQWGMPAEAIEGVRRALLERGEVGTVNQAMRAAGVDVTREQLEAVKSYLFDSRGIAFDRANVEAWNRLASGRAQIRDVAFLVHELAEIRAFEAERRRSGFDYRGAGVDRLSATERARWDADFNRHYLAAHSEALAAEYAYVAQAVAEATNGRVRIGRNIAAAIDPTRAEARANMMVDGRPLSEHADFATWAARGTETVEIGAGAAERLRLRTRTPTLADLIAAVKGGGADPRGAAGRGGFTSLTVPAGDPTASAGRSGASDARVATWLATLDPRRAARLDAAGHVAALHGARAVVDFLVRPGETNVGPLEAWVTSSRLPPGEAIAILNDVLARRGALTGDQVNAMARAMRGDFYPPTSRTSSRADLVRAAGLLATDPRYAANPARAVEDLRALVGDNVELPVAVGELSRGSGSLVLGDSTIAGAGALGPDVTLTVPGTSTIVGRELVATTPTITPGVTPTVALENALVNNLSGKFVDYARPAVTATVREIAVQVRRPVTGENLDVLLTTDFLNRVVERTRNTSSVYGAGLHNSISRITFYNSQGQHMHTWTPAAPP